MSRTDPSRRDPFSSERVDRALDQLGSISLQRYSMESLLQTVTELAKSVMPDGIGGRDRTSRRPWACCASPVRADRRPSAPVGRL